MTSGENIIIEALLTRLNECYKNLKTGITPKVSFYEGRLDGLFIAVNTAIAGTNLKLIFNEKSGYYELIEEE